MKINDKLNNTILNNNVTEEFLKNFSGKRIIDNISFIELKADILHNNYDQLVFNNTFYYYNDSEIMYLMELLNNKNIKFINITSNIEESLYSDYIFVYDSDNLVIEGNIKDVLKEEKILKKTGYGLPFTVDLSTQLQLYNVLDKTYYDIYSLVGDLWN